MLKLNVTNRKTQETITVQVPHTYLSVAAAHDAAWIAFGLHASCDVRDPDETIYYRVSEGHRAQAHSDAPPAGEQKEA